MKVVVIGGSAQSTPALFEYLGQEAHTCALKVMLVGRNRGRLAAVARAARLLSAGSSTEVDYAEVEGRQFDRALEGADVVILQTRVGGYSGREFDETFPLRYGQCGDEGLGLGGLSAAWRSWPEIRPLIKRVSEVAKGALLLILSSPLGILVRAAATICPQVRAVGICELPWTTLTGICRHFGESPVEVEFDYSGVNHLGWFHNISAGGRDLVREYSLARRGSSDFPSGELIDQCSGVPVKYLRLHYHQGEVVNQQREAHKARGKILDELSRAAFPVYRSGSRGEIKAVLALRAAPWYQHAVGPLLLALSGHTVRIPFFLSAPNEGFHPWLNEEDVVEMAYRVENGRLKRLGSSRPAPAHAVELTRAFVEFDKVATDAVVRRDVSGLYDSLKVHPWTRELKNRQEMVRDITLFPESNERAAT
jgi:6-phospho-beta-glucosidase